LPPPKERCAEGAERQVRIRPRRIKKFKYHRRKMKVPKKIFIIAAVTFVAVFAAAYLFLLIEGKALVVSQLENALRRKVRINYFGLHLPLKVEIRDLDIEGLVKIDQVLASPSLPGILSGKTVFNDLKVIYERTNAETPVASPSIPANIGAQAQQVSRPQVEQKDKSVSKQEKYLRLVIKRLDVEDGTVDFIDRTLPGEGIKIKVKDINLHLSNLYIYPRSAITKFELSGSIPWLKGQAEGRVEAKGWVNLYKKDIQAALNIKDIDGVYLYPYYAEWVDLAKARVQNAKLNLDSDITGKDNIILAKCHLELTDIVFQQRKEEEMSKSEKIAETILGIFKAMSKGSNIAVNFTVKTKMTNPEFDFGYIKTAVEDRLREGAPFYANSIFVKIPLKLANKTANTATDLTHAAYNGTFGLAKVIKDTLKLAFQKE